MRTRVHATDRLAVRHARPPAHPHPVVAVSALTLAVACAPAGVCPALQGRREVLCRNPSPTLRCC